MKSVVVWESDFDLDLEPGVGGGVLGVDGVGIDGADGSLGRMTDRRFVPLPEGRSASFVVTSSTDAWVLEGCFPDVGGRGVGPSRSVLSGWDGGGAGF